MTFSPRLKVINYISSHLQINLTPCVPLSVSERGKLNLGDTPRPPMGTRVPYTFLTFGAIPIKGEGIFHSNVGEWLHSFLLMLDPHLRRRPYFRRDRHGGGLLLGVYANGF